MTRTKMKMTNRPSVMELNRLFGTTEFFLTRFYGQSCVAIQSEKATDSMISKLRRYYTVVHTIDYWYIMNKESK